MIIANRYEVIKSIGRGGMGEVYLAKDLHNNKEIAIKKIIPDLENKISEKNLKRWQSEIATMSKIIHKNVVEIYDYQFGPGINDYYIAMEFIKGSNLDEIIRKRVFLDQQEAIYYVKQILDACDYMNKKDIIHRDLKPANIMVKSSGEIKICDMGLAKLKKYNLNITNVMGVPGTRYYLAPEVLRNYKATVQSEIFSIGVILYELLAGNKPFKEDVGDDVENAKRKVNYKILNSPLPIIKNVAKEVPQALENVVIKATAKLPRERHQSFAEFKKDLNTVFSQARRFEQKLIVVNKFSAMFDMEKNQNNDIETQKLRLPTHTKIFVGILLICMLGVIIYYAK